MSDDQTLMKRLREVGGMSDDGATRWYINPDGPDAADRIEKLESNFQLQLEWYLSNKRVLDDRIEKLEAALCNVTTTWDVWQKEKDSNSFTELFASICEAKALEGKDD